MMLRNSILLALACLLGMPLTWSQGTGSDESTATLPLSKPEAVDQAWNAKQRFFILVTVDKYTTPAADLPFAAVDSKRVSDLLKNGQYESLGTSDGTNATRDNFIRRLLQRAWLFSGRKNHRDHYDRG
jgi:hypothetical protein